jgi:hypothetical protein
LVAFVGGSLVPDRGGGCGVAEPRHDFLEGCSVLGGEGAGGVAEIVEPDGGHTYFFACRGPLLLEPPFADHAAGLAGEEGSVGVAGGEPEEVFVEDVEHEPGEHDLAPRRRGFGVLSSPTLVDGFLDGERPFELVVVATPKCSELAVSEPTKAGNKDEGGESRVGDVGEGEHDIRGDERAVADRVLAGASDGAGVSGDQLVFDRGREDRLEGPVCLGGGCGDPVGEWPVPSSNEFRGDPVQGKLAERRVDVAGEEVGVCVSGHRAETAPLQPVLGVGLEVLLAAARVEDRSPGHVGLDVCPV